VLQADVTENGSGVYLGLRVLGPVASNVLAVENLECFLQ